MRAIIQFSCARSRLAVMVSGSLLSLAAHAGYVEGVSAYNKSQYASALAEWRPLAEQGDANTQFRLGWMYERGEGVRQDLQQAAE